MLVHAEEGDLVGGDVHVLALRAEHACPVLAPERDAVLRPEQGHRAVGLSPTVGRVARVTRVLLIVQGLDLEGGAGVSNG